MLLRIEHPRDDRFILGEPESHPNVALINDPGRANKARFPRSPRRPLHLVYCEYHSSKTDALRREKYLKTTAGKKALKLMLRDALSDAQ